MPWTEHKIGTSRTVKKKPQNKVEAKAHANTYTQNRKKLKEVSKMTNYYKDIWTQRSHNLAQVTIDTSENVIGVSWIIPKEALSEMKWATKRNTLSIPQIFDIDCKHMSYQLGS